MAGGEPREGLPDDGGLGLEGLEVPGVRIALIAEGRGAGGPGAMVRRLSPAQVKAARDDAGLAPCQEVVNAVAKLGVFVVLLWADVHGLHLHADALQRPLQDPVVDVVAAEAVATPHDDALEAHAVGQAQEALQAGALQRRARMSILEPPPHPVAATFTVGTQLPVLPFEAPPVLLLLLP